MLSRKRYAYLAYFTYTLHSEIDHCRFSASSGLGIRATSTGQDA